MEEWKNKRETDKTKETDATTAVQPTRIVSERKPFGVVSVGVISLVTDLIFDKIFKRLFK